MDRMKAYAELAADLDFYRRLPHDELARLVGGPVVERSSRARKAP